jgi:ketosteroid isomerase-like protein
MSDENVELVRRGYEEHALTGEAPAWALHEDIVWHALPDEADAATLVGSEAVKSYVREWPAAFDDFHGEVEELVDHGDYVVAAIVLRARMKGTTTEITMPETQVWKLSDGKVIEVREYHDHKEALDAVAAAASDATAGLTPARSRTA